MALALVMSMSNSSYRVIETATRGLYQVVNTKTGMRTQPWPLARCKRILKALAR